MGSGASKREGSRNFGDYGKLLVLKDGDFGVTEKELGRGAYSVVKMGVHLSVPDDTPLEDREVAVKCINTLSLKSRDRKSLEDEVRIMRGLDHPHIVKMYADIHGEEGMYYIVMERVEGGELFDRVVELESYNEEQARATAVVLLDALMYLHSKKICHRDLKPENLLLKSKTTDSDIKIADFGFAQEASTAESLTEMCGTPGYVAPEVIRMGLRDRAKDDVAGYGLPCDMWSVGVIIFVLLGGYPPFDDDDQKVLFHLISTCSYEFHQEFWADISDAAKDLISKLLVLDPSKRITAEEALKHPWLELSDTELRKRDLHKNQEAMKKWNHRRKLRKVYMAVVATNRMKNLLGGIRKGAAAAEDEEAAAAATTTTTATTGEEEATQEVEASAGEAPAEVAATAPATAPVTAPAAEAVAATGEETAPAPAPAASEENES